AAPHRRADDDNAQHDERSLNSHDYASRENTKRRKKERKREREKEKKRNEAVGILVLSFSPSLFLFRRQCTFLSNPSARAALICAAPADSRAWIRASRAAASSACALVVSTLPVTPAVKRSRASESSCSARRTASPASAN